jgi:hypothetical protein
MVLGDTPPPRRATSGNGLKSHAFGRASRAETHIDFVGTGQLERIPWRE